MKFSANSAAKALGITKVTMLKWILQERVQHERREIGGKTYYEIAEAEVKRLKGLIVRKRQKGFSLLKNAS